MPDEFYRKPAGVRAFCYASMMVALEAAAKKGGDADGGEYGEN